MRKVNAGLFISLDGVTEAPHLWQFDHFDEEMMATMGAHNPCLFPAASRPAR